MKFFYDFYTENKEAFTDNQSLFVKNEIYERDNNLEDYYKNKEILRSKTSSNDSSKWFEIYISDNEMNIEYEDELNPNNLENINQFYFNMNIDLDENNLNKTEVKALKVKKQKKYLINDKDLKRISRQYFLNQKRNVII
jgi:hypothetical protein